MYGTILRNILDQRSIPSGKEGYYFLDAGEASWKEISEHIAVTGKKHCDFASGDVKEVSVEELTTLVGNPFLTPSMVEMVWGSK